MRALNQKGVRYGYFQTTPMARLPLLPGILVLIATAVLAAGIVSAGMDSYGDFATASSTSSSAAVRKPPATPVAGVDVAAAREGT